MSETLNQALAAAKNSRILAVIPLWYQKRTLLQFVDVVRTLCEFPIQHLHLVVQTNVIDNDTLATISNLLDHYRSERCKIELCSERNLLGQYDLYWRHRSLIVSLFFAGRYTHFIYTENDVRFSFENFCYFLTFREPLAEHGLLPSFVRVEFSSSDAKYVSTDLVGRQELATTIANLPRRAIPVGTYLFVPLDNAYIGMYILDVDAALEFVTTNSFDIIQSKSVVCWEASERAASGLCVENVPAGFTSRYVVPIESQQNRISSCAWIYHLSNEFAENQNATNPFGRIAMNEVFSEPASNEALTIQSGPWSERLKIGQAIPTFESDAVLSVGDFSDLLAALSSSGKTDLRFEHAPSLSVHSAGNSLQRGINWFGATESPAAREYKDGSFHMLGVETLLLNDVLLSPHSAVVCSLSMGFYYPSIQNFYLIARDLSPLTNNDPYFQLSANSECVFAPKAKELHYHHVNAVVVCGTGFHNFGHFLYDGLPVVFLLRDIIVDGNLTIVGPPLAPWQQELLELLGLLNQYKPMFQPAIFRRAIVPNLISFHVSYPTRYVRPVFDALKFRAGAPSVQGAKRIFISRQSDQTKRVLVNRAAVEALFQEYGFVVVHPEKMSIRAQIRLFSGASIIAGESGAGMGNVGFCEPGTRVFEIQPVAFPETWTRAACMVFGLTWHVFFAPASTPEATTTLSKPDLEFIVSLVELDAALKAAFGSPP
jgi:hypothetical protein